MMTDIVTGKFIARYRKAATRQAKPWPARKDLAVTVAWAQRPWWPPGCRDRTVDRNRTADL